MPRPESQFVRASIQESMEVKARLLDLADAIVDAADLMVDALAVGGRIYFVGNGGSAADAQHLAAELIGRFDDDNRLPAMALTTDTSVLTALANDFGFETVFARQVEALARPGDMLVAISTSGNSPNILAAIEEARRQGMPVLGLAGKDGGRMAALCDRCLVVPSQRHMRIQEAHITLGHILCHLVEEARRQGRIPPRSTAKPTPAAVSP